MMLTAIAVLAIVAVPAGDQWSSMFDHGDRWPTCSVTYSGPNTPALRRAVRDVERASGVDLVRVPSGGQIVARHERGQVTDRIGEAAPAVTDGRYTSVSIAVWTQGMSSWSRRIVWRHELGHALGLGHSAEPADPMYSSTETSPGPGWVALFGDLYPECREGRK